MVGLFNLGGGEIILVLALMMILVAGKWLPHIARGLGAGFLDGLFEFRKASREVAEDVDKEAFDAGRSLGGVNGSPAAQAITADNRVGELYSPAVFGERPFNYRRYVNRWKSLTRMIARMVRRFFLKLH
jgi:sec-independent protein translocase protein TatA